MSQFLELKDFNEFNVEQLYALLKLRCDVFIVEQQCAYPDIDGLDPVSKHILVMNDAGHILGALRILQKYDDGDVFKISRVLVSKDARGQGIAGKLMNAALSYCAATNDDARVELQAQDYLKDFYGGLGFYATSETYLDDGIPHIDMRLRVPPES
ncbi:putative N-acetyltransferase YjcF [Pseudovibrio sp. Ad13]|uniref:GNAT family N-acetyltransferase n=1 Tax=unclassified Pseudovibrio TaxID=2627060 RepID=UPI0007AE6165|nr:MULTISPECIES: GNAT family N-acetyltransferase [unclassified Pseudovibrio]KZK80396.1 putative N-acetyltransferase YjcF [Pseudovibrio sp. Ad13]KZK94780.1 putative N-acetyltransferase YjcF [Pseudovibrio sp. W74]KZL04661.1 putative acyltransferase [Pseudovibrio sp. Ad14]